MADTATTSNQDAATAAAAAASTSLTTWKARLAVTRDQVACFQQQQQQQQPDDSDEEIAAWIHTHVCAGYDVALQDLWTIMSSSSSNNDNNNNQHAILTVRTILRYFLVTLGVPMPHRVAVQALYTTTTTTTTSRPTKLSFLNALAQIIIAVNDTRRDNKSAVLACRLLTNLVTNNSQSSRHVLSYWPWQPQPLLNQTEQTRPHHGNQNVVTTTWLDILLAAATADRTALAALVICWYNALQAIEQEATCADTTTTTTTSSVVQSIINAPLVVSNLMRHALPSTAVMVSSSCRRRLDHDDERNTQDEATEWIALLTSLLCQKGSLASLYQATTGHCSSSSSSNNHMASYVGAVVLPEQVLLLQLLLAHVQDLKANEASHLLGDLTSRLHDNVCFLAKDLYQNIRRAILQSDPNKDDEDDDTNKHNTTPRCDETTLTLGPTALSLIRELLAEVLIHSTTATQKLREILCREESIVPTWIQDLAFYFDCVQAKFQGRPAKEIVLTKEEQRIFVSLVRLLGNLCHGSQAAQDCLRQTLVPMPKGTAGTKQANELDSALRNGLHLLLSCTSLSHTCFTLREWSVVAIRNALDNNIENQAIVAQLEAQQAAPSAPLAEMGMRVKLEKNGKASLQPIDEEKM